MVAILCKPEWLVKCAYTLKAAINIGGDTIDGIFGFSRKNSNIFNRNLSTALENAKLIIVDVCSMVGKRKLGVMHVTLGKYTIAQDHISFYFEFTEQKRQNDADYLKLLRNIRNQQITDSGMHYLSTNCRLPELESFDLGQLLQTPIIVSRNEIRYNWNRKFKKLFAQHTEKPVTYTESIDQIDCEPTPVVKAELLKAMPEYLQHTLHLVIGMPIMVISKNMYKTLGVVNGSSGTLTGIITDQTSRVVALQLSFSTTSSWRVGGLPPNTILIKRVTANASVTLLNGKPSSYDANNFRSQRPLPLQITKPKQIVRV
ncbi:hypothetical protein BC833DRAFT_626272 [Globomyces pollinis-pini]|nr:hypothetical protein BC833DRAFT_626272 [Globomyces pollinis-pini]